VLIEVSRPYVDVSACDLSLTLGAAPAAAIEIVRASVGGHALELRLLGYSHQVLVAGGDELSETVAGRRGAAGALPHEHVDGAYRFRARVERHPAAVYAARASGVLASVAGDRCALAGVFAPPPGELEPDRPPLPAFTALAAHALASGAGIAWMTWHGYPQTGEIVVTSSRLERPA
jgi:hypothetical protein